MVWPTADENDPINNNIEQEFGCRYSSMCAAFEEICLISERKSINIHPLILTNVFPRLTQSGWFIQGETLYELQELLNHLPLPTDNLSRPHETIKLLKNAVDKAINSCGVIALM